MNLLFTSPLFLCVILPTIIFLCFVIRQCFVKFLLVFASLFLYAWGEPYAVMLLFLLSAVNYLLGFGCAAKNRRHACFWLVIGNALNLSVLCLYKYSEFWGGFLPSGNLISSLLLPMGMSFYVFQLISYQMDVSRGVIREERNFLDFLLFATFFPKMICGPIARYGDFAGGLMDCRIRPENFVEGVRRFGIGLGKKVLIADMMARIADPIFASPVETIPCVYCWVGAITYTLQIYFDFSGYSDMAIGLARIFNFRFQENFNYPYCSRSVQEFWRRWHISLSIWFRDYLYIPLGGNRRGTLRTYANQLVVFLLCGVWHGASWTFLAWGAYHGLGLTLEKAGLKKVLERLPAVFSNFYVILFVLFGWVLFRADSFTFAGKFIYQMLLGNSAASFCTYSNAIMFVDYSGICIAVGGFLLSYPVLPRWLDRIDRRFLMIISASLFFLSFVFSVTGTFSPGIYGAF